MCSIDFIHGGRTDAAAMSGNAALGVSLRGGDGKECYQSENAGEAFDQTEK